MANLHKVSILVKTFLRDQYLYETIDAILQGLPETQVIVVDDGETSAEKRVMYQNLRQQGHLVSELSFDSGFGHKSNVGMELCTRPYLLIGSDDFDFRPRNIREDLEKLVFILDNDIADIASGRVNNNPYEYWLGEEPAGVWRETPATKVTPIRCNDGWLEVTPCDLTVNYSLIRRSLLGRDKVHWDDDVKIGGGEHGAFFIDVKRAGGRVVYANGVNICEQVGRPVDPRYGGYRGRARQPERPCFTRRGVTQYYCGDGTADIKGAAR